MIAAFHAENRPGTSWTTHRCDHNRWHVTEAADDPRRPEEHP